MNIESHVTSIIEGETKAPLKEALLRVMSGGYRAGSRLHRAAFDTLIPSKHLSVPVISVGNIVAGGSGKTPLVHYLARALAPKKVAILSRGYKRKSKKKHLVVRNDMTAAECGDEPKLLKYKLPKTCVVVGKDRAFSGHLAIRTGAEVILLDDGLQHRNLHRDIEIIAMDAQNLFGGGHFLPFGYLRSDPKVLQSADLIVLAGIRDREHFEQIEKELCKWTDSPLTSMEATFENRKEIAGKSVGAFCAIARPRRFFKTLESFGCNITDSRVKPDHDPFPIQELSQFAKQAKEKGATCLVCTEKDSIKWSEIPKLCLPVIPLRMSLEPQFGSEYLEKLIHGVFS